MLHDNFLLLTRLLKVKLEEVHREKQLDVRDLADKQLPEGQTNDDDSSPLLYSNKLAPLISFL
jgi:hypothetical protein